MPQAGMRAPEIRAAKPNSPPKQGWEPEHVSKAHQYLQAF